MHPHNDQLKLTVASRPWSRSSRRPRAHSCAGPGSLAGCCAGRKEVVGGLANMRRRSSILFAALAVVIGAGQARAGGDSVPVRIRSFSRTSAQSATFVLAGISSDVVANCSQITVVAEYSLWTWPWAKPVVTRGEHELALDHLSRDFVAQADTRFGVLGTGLGEDPQAGACHFRSRALSLLEEIGGGSVVYSFFKT